MRITLRRSGGFANILVAREVNTDHLRVTDAQQLEALVREAERVAVPASQAGADVFQYRLHIDDGKEDRGYLLDDATMPAEWRMLIEFLSSCG